MEDMNNAYVHAYMSTCVSPRTSTYVLNCHLQGSKGKGHIYAEFVDTGSDSCYADEEMVC